MQEYRRTLRFGAHHAFSDSSPIVLIEVRGVSSQDVVRAFFLVRVGMFSEETLSDASIASIPKPVVFPFLRLTLSR